jgi:hypothetical protein
MDPNEFRNQLAKNVNKQMNEMIASGEIQGDPIPVEIPTPVTAELEATPPEAKAKEAPTAPEKKEETETDTERLVFGKYKSEQEAEKGYYEMVNRFSPVLEENKRLKEQILSLAGMGQPQPANGAGPLVPGSSPGAAPRVNPVARGNVDWRHDDAVAKLAESLSVEPDQIAQLAEKLLERATETAQDVVAERFAPIQAQAEAEAYARNRYPEAYKFLPELKVFIEMADVQTQQTLQALVASNNHLAAMEYAWTKFKDQMQVNTKATMQVNAQAAEAERKVVKAAASVPSGGPGTPIHAADPNANDPDPKLLADLREKMQEGNVDATTLYRRLMVGRMLPPHLRTWEQT